MSGGVRFGERWHSPNYSAVTNRCLQHQAQGIFKQLHPGSHELGGFSAVAHPVVYRDGAFHPPANGELTVFHHRHLLAGADRQDGCFRRIDDRNKVIDIEHPQVADRKSRAGDIVWVDFALPGAPGFSFDFFRNLAHRFAVGVVGHHGEQSVFDGYSDADIDIAVLHHAVSIQGGIEVGEFGAGPGRWL